MSFDSLLTTRVRIRRAGSSTIVATMPAHVEALSLGALAAQVEAGAPDGDHGGYLRVADVRVTDVLEDTTSGLFYEVRGVLSAANRGHHLELNLRKVVDA